MASCAAAGLGLAALALDNADETIRANDQTVAAAEAELSRRDTHPDWALLHSTACGFQVRYPTEGDLVSWDDYAAYIELPIPSGTTLIRKYMEIDCRVETQCASPLGGGPSSGGAFWDEINGIDFLVESGGEGAAGSIYTWESYSTERNGYCITLTFVFQSGHSYNWTPPRPEFDQDAEAQIFSEILNTFSFSSP